MGGVLTFLEIRLPKLRVVNMPLRMPVYYGTFVVKMNGFGVFGFGVELRVRK